MKKILSVFLTVVMMFTVMVPSFAAMDRCTCGETPSVYVAALGSGSVILDEGTENERTLFRPETGDILEILLPVVPAAAELIATKNYDKFGDVLIGCVNEAFGMLALDENGNSHPRVTSEEFHPETADHGGEHSYYFGYDFRLDPVENAEKLHTYLEEVEEITGHEDVKIRASSMGGVVMLAYIRLYGTADIETIIFQNCPLLGTAVAGELFNGKFEINKDALVRYAECALPAIEIDFVSGLLYALCEALDAAGVFEALLGMVDGIVVNLKDRVFDECLIPIFGTLPGIWSFVPDEYYESGKEFMKLDPATQSGLIAKLDFYHYEVQGKAEQLLRSAQADGTNIYIVAGYNMQRTPLVSAYMETSDGTVDTKYASCGATCAPIGSQLPEDYTQARFNDINYISPDRMIDASTCMLPECTWFVKDMLHSTTHDGHGVFYDKLFASEEQLTVFDMEEYPQFMQNDTINQTFVPVAELSNPVEDAFNMMEAIPSFLNFVKLVTAVLETVVDFVFKNVIPAL